MKNMNKRKHMKRKEKDNEEYRIKGNTLNVKRKIKQSKTEKGKNMQDKIEGKPRKDEIKKNMYTPAKE